MLIILMLGVANAGQSECANSNAGLALKAKNPGIPITCKFVAANANSDYSNGLLSAISDVPDVPQVDGGSAGGIGQAAVQEGMVARPVGVADAQLVVAGTAKGAIPLATVSLNPITTFQGDPNGKGARMTDVSVTVPIALTTGDTDIDKIGYAAVRWRVNGAALTDNKVMEELGAAGAIAFSESAKLTDSIAASLLRFTTKEEVDTCVSALSDSTKNDTIAEACGVSTDSLEPAISAMWAASDKVQARVQYFGVVVEYEVGDLDQEFTERSKFTGALALGGPIPGSISSDGWIEGRGSLGLSSEKETPDSTSVSALSFTAGVSKVALQGDQQPIDLSLGVEGEYDFSSPLSGSVVFGTSIPMNSQTDAALAFVVPFDGSTPTIRVSGNFGIVPD